MNPLRSIRWRLQLWYGALFAAVLGVLGVAAYRFEADRRLELFDAELQRLCAGLNGSIRSQFSGPPRGGRGGGRGEGRATSSSDAEGEKNGKADKGGKDEKDARDGKGEKGGRGEKGEGRGPRTPPPAVPVVTTSSAVGPESVARGIYWAVWTHNGVPFSASANAPLPLPRPTEDEHLVRQRGGLREVFINAAPGDYALVGRSLAADLQSLHRFGWMLAGGGLAVFALVLAIGWWLVNRALRPVSAIGEAATRIATGDLARRIDTRDTDSELGQLASVLNATFARLEASFAQQARFTADAAHELRTPVTVMLTHVQNALATPGASEEHREAFEACQRAAQRMRRLIETLLQLARLDAGQESDVAPARVDLAAVARDSVDHVRPLAAQRRVTLHVEGEPAACLGAADLLGQVVTNLVTNAIHHNRSGGEARIATRIDGDYVELTVADYGPGIPEAHLPHIFERFYRVDKARTGAQGRTGLGLAIVRAIVEAHSGEVTVRSTVGAGTTFTVRLPRASA